MLATQLKPLVEDHTLDKNMVVRITQYTANTVQNRKILILLNLEVLSPALDHRIGNPQNIEAVQAGGAQGGAAAPAAAPAKPAAAPAAAAPSVGAQALAKANPATGARGVAKASSGLPVYPIEALSPYQNKWTIKARVTLKSDIKHWSNARGEGKLFSVNLLDESGEIRATGFNDAVDRFYPLLQENKVYFISKAKVNIAKKQFSNLPNEYEIALESNSEIEECTETSDVPEVKYQFVPIDRLSTVEPNQTTDVVAILDSYSDVSEIVSKATQRPIKKRELTLIDSSGMSVRLTLWGQQAENFERTIAGEEKPVLAFKGVKVSDFGGRSLSMFSSSSMSLNPDIPESHGLRGWYDNGGHTAEIKSFTRTDAAPAGAGGALRPNERRTLEQVKDESLGTSSERPDYFNTRATILYIRPNNLYYTACPECNKKVIDEGDGWRCEKCDRSFPAPVRRYIFSANIADYSGQIWISGFNEIGQQLLGISADELDALRVRRFPTHPERERGRVQGGAPARRGAHAPLQLPRQAGDVQRTCPLTHAGHESRALHRDAGGADRLRQGGARARRVDPPPPRALAPRRPSAVWYTCYGCATSRRHRGHTRLIRRCCTVHSLWKLRQSLATYMCTHGQMHASWPSRNCCRQMPHRSTRTPTTLSFFLSLPEDDTRWWSSSTRPTAIACSSSDVSFVVDAGPKNSPNSVAHSYCVAGSSSCATTTSKSVTPGLASGDGAAGAADAAGVAGPASRSGRTGDTGVAGAAAAAAAASRGGFTARIVGAVYAICSSSRRTGGAASVR